MALRKFWADRHAAPRSEFCRSDIINYAGAAIINGPGIAYELRGQSPRNFHIQYGQVALPRMSFDLSKAVTGRAQNFGQLNSFGRDNRHYLVAKGQALLNGYPEVSPADEAQPIGQSIYWVIHIQQDLGNRADVYNRLAETQESRERAPTLHYGDGANSVQRHIGYSRQHDEPKRDEYGGTH